jgi:hypothetical protein
MYELILSKWVSETLQTPGGRNEPCGQRPDKVQKVSGSKSASKPLVHLMHLYTFRLHTLCLNPDMKYLSQQ